MEDSSTPASKRQKTNETPMARPAEKTTDFLSLPACVLALICESGGKKISRALLTSLAKEDHRVPALRKALEWQLLKTRESRQDFSTQRLTNLFDDDDVRSDRVLIEAIRRSAMPHGSCHIDADESNEALERVNAISLGGADGTRVLFLIAAGDQNVCDNGCWCAGFRFFSLHVFLPSEGESARAVQLFKCGTPTGNAAGMGLPEAMPAALQTRGFVNFENVGAKDEVCTKLGIQTTEFGVILRALILVDLADLDWWKFIAPIPNSDMRIGRGTDMENKQVGLKLVTESPHQLLPMALKTLAPLITPVSCQSLLALDAAINDHGGENDDLVGGHCFRIPIVIQDASHGWQQATREIAVQQARKRWMEIYSTEDEDEDEDGYFDDRPPFEFAWRVDDAPHEDCVDMMGGCVVM